MRNIFHIFGRAAVCAVVVLAAASLNYSQARAGARARPPAATVGPKVTAIDVVGLRKLLKPGAKPLMINFWATWCGPCIQEFPDLVRLDEQYKGRIDFITVSLDDRADIGLRVPKFLKRMNATMPAYLLATPDENAAISLVSADWAGNLPFTIIYKPSGETAYVRKGPVKIPDVQEVLDKLLNAAGAAAP